MRTMMKFIILDHHFIGTFIVCSLEKDVSKRPRYDTLLKHQFILTTEADHDTDVGAWYQSVLVQATAN